MYPFGAKYVADRLEELNLEYTWQDCNEMTWKRGGAMSKLDRIYARLCNYKLLSTATDWTMCESDHAMVKVTYVSSRSNTSGPKICRLNPGVVLNNDSLM
jgi:hypothetical protein